MRGLLAFALSCVAMGAMAQPSGDIDPNPPKPGPTPNLFLTDKQDITIVARKHNLGSDILTVTVEDTFSAADLKQRIQKLGEILGSEILALSVEKFNPNPQNPTGGYIRAEFGVRGLIDREKGTLGMQPLARAFVGGSNPQIDSLFIQYETEAPSTNILQQWKAPDGTVLLQGRASPQFGLEYKVKLYTQDPEKIRIPEGAAALEEQKTPPKPAPAPRSDTWIWVLVVIAALAIGALVYSLLIRPRPAARR